MTKFCFNLKFLVMATIAVCLWKQAAGQSPYDIKIQEQEIKADTGFLKMGSNISAEGNVLSYNNSFLTKNGQAWYPVMGEMHYSRCAVKDWEPAILKMKSCGIQIISTYIFWNYAEDEEGAFNWSGNNNLRAFLSLCKKHNMYVWLRPGPWVHAELRNGGFPDWLIKKNIGLRKNDSRYLTYVKRFYSEIAKQCKDYWFKQNGTIIGVQIENELDFRNPAAFNHMITLKKIAVDVGLDVPYYSAFGQGPDTQSEFLYMMGSYPDSPWSQNTRKLIKPVYFIKPLEADRDIGSDLLGKVDGKVRNTYPKISTELGGGMQVTYHRRTRVSAKDIAVNAFTKVASGLNGLGYYMFQGGLNPTRTTSLQESRATDYPNDVPLINYDFQSPIGAMNILRDSYNELRLQHMFINDFGSSLAGMPSYFPDKRKTLASSADTVQCAVRVKDNSGFIFLSNFQRNVEMADVKNFQIKLETREGTITIPQAPVTFKKNDYAIWPYNFKIGNAILTYANAQPLCILHNEGHEVYVFFSNEKSEFVFNKTTIKKIKLFTSGLAQGNKVRFEKNKLAGFDITDIAGKVSKVLILTREQALKSYKIKLKNKEILMMSNVGIVCDKDTLGFEKTGFNATVKITTFPRINLKSSTALFTCTSIDQKNLFTGYELTPLKIAKGEVSFKEDKSFTDTATANAYMASVIKNYATHKNFKRNQQGPLYGLVFHDLPGQKKYNLQFNVSAGGLIKDWEATLSYDADIMTLYRGKQLVYDQFNYNDTCKIRLSNFIRKPEEQLSLQLLPLPAGSDIYVEDDMRETRDKRWPSPLLKKITVQPVFYYKVIAD